MDTSTNTAAAVTTPTPAKYGIDNLKKIIKFACDFTSQINSALADGKFTWIESFGFIPEIMQIPDVVRSFPAIKQEFDDLDTGERQQLLDYVAQNFNIPNQHAELVIVASLGFAMNAISLVEQWKTLKG